jgi:hypothetical protein
MTGRVRLLLITTGVAMLVVAAFIYTTASTAPDRCANYSCEVGTFPHIGPPYGTWKPAPPSEHNPN